MVSSGGCRPAALLRLAAKLLPLLTPLPPVGSESDRIWVRQELAGQRGKSCTSLQYRSPYLKDCCWRCRSVRDRWRLCSNALQLPDACLLRLSAAAWKACFRPLLLSCACIVQSYACSKRHSNMIWPLSSLTCHYFARDAQHEQEAASGSSQEGAVQKICEGVPADTRRLAL